MDKVSISTNFAPQAIGPYSQAVRTGNLLFLSGQIPVDPKTGEMVSGSVEEQAKQVLENIKGLLKSQNLSMSNVIKTTVFLTDISNFAKVNEIYATYFEKPYPARSCVEVSALPKNALLEIEAIAVTD